MPSSFGATGTIEELLAAIAARIVAESSIAATAVFESLNDDDLGTFPPCDLFVQIAPLSGRPYSGDQDGMGYTTLDLSIAVNLWTRLDIDVGYQDSQLLRNATYGLLANWQQIVFTPLELWTPVDADDVGILVQPMRLRQVTFAPRRKPHGWAKFASVWNCPLALVGG